MSTPKLKKEIVESIDFGEQVAEQESSNLSKYFVETEHWKKVEKDQVDVVYGSKGAGKSAIYSLLFSRSDSFLKRNIILCAAENPRGGTAFAEVSTDPPATEINFERLWKLYILGLIAGEFTKNDMDDENSRDILSALSRSNLIPDGGTLKEKLRAAMDYVKYFLEPDSATGGVVLDPTTGLPVGVTGTISFKTPTTGQSKLGISSIDTLFSKANKALHLKNKNIWICIDRLDVAFKDSTELEANALRALFKVYLDLVEFESIKLKIFLRKDIWERIVEQGFREASHITKTLTINWTNDSLLNLVMIRLLQSDKLIGHYTIDRNSILADIDEQGLLFYKIFPKQIDNGEKKPKTLDWMLTRTCDAGNETAPRELIHLLKVAKDRQLQEYDIGKSNEGDSLFSGSSFKTALTEVSKVRLEQTLYAEFPDVKQWVEKLKSEKATQNLASLSRIWSVTEDQASEVANKLVKVGFFESRGDKTNPDLFIPFLYRGALQLVQGAAD